MSITIFDHRLQDQSFKASPNHGGVFAKDLPDAIIVHFTAGSSAESSINWLCNPLAKASAHVLVGRDGGITQLVPFNTIAWHAGVSSFGERSGYNKFAIGIEMDNPGRLRRTEGGGFLSSFGHSYSPEQVIEAIHRNERTPSYWLAYTEPQINAVFDLCAALCAHYNILEILGHEEIAPGRKIDPGPAFPLEQLRQRLIFRGRDLDSAPDDEATGKPIEPATVYALVTADKLNFRASPAADAPKISSPLLRGTQVEVIDQQPGWYRIIVEGKTGWVKAEYLKVTLPVG